MDFSKASQEFLQLSEFARTASVEELVVKKTECLNRAKEIFSLKNASQEMVEFANMLVNFAECELCGIEINRG